MWDKGWRDRIWSVLDTKWDLIVIGGGITGAGILREGVRAGLRVLLVEADDFASGTSSRSSKLVHGGFRYLKNAQLKLTLESVRERERLLKEGRGLINPLGFLMVSYKDDPLPKWVFGAGLVFYDLLAFKWGHRYYDAYDMRELCPFLNEEKLQGGYRYFDAQTDDARLVLRLIQEAVRDGGAALNYTRATRLLRQKSGKVSGVIIEDLAPGGNGRTSEIQGQIVINATGAWADELRTQVGGRNRLRKLRGSHLVFPAHKLPLTRAVSIWHPKDGRPVFAFPWEGVTIVGTTDVDHHASLQTDPAISSEEVEYLMTAIDRAFPELELELDDIQATFSGFRPVIDTGKTDPSKESREHVLWNENGLLTVTGGKLTTFRLMALAALKAAGRQIPERISRTTLHEADGRVLDPVPAETLPDKDLYEGPHKGLHRARQMRLVGRYGMCAAAAIAVAQQGELESIAETPLLWAELRWAARAEGVVHLDDLLLRRVRLGLLLPNGGLDEIKRIRSIVQPELEWNDTRWDQELEEYTQLWKKCYYFEH